jgi:hypothetical protein
MILQKVNESNWRNNGHVAGLSTTKHCLMLVASVFTAVSGCTVKQPTHQPELHNLQCSPNQLLAAI